MKSNGPIKLVLDLRAFNISLVHLHTRPKPVAHRVCRLVGRINDCNMDLIGAVFMYPLIGIRMAPLRSPSMAGLSSNLQVSHW